MEAFQDAFSALLVECKVIGGMDQHIVHVDDKPSFVNEVMEGVVHIGLEGGWGVAESKEHNCGFIERKRGGEGCFLMVFWSDEDIIISPTDIEFGEDFAVLQLIYQFRNEG